MLRYAQTVLGWVSEVIVEYTFDGERDLDSKA